MNFFRNFVVTLTLLALTSAVYAQDSGAQPSSFVKDKEAMRILKDMSSAYKNLKSYSDTAIVHTDRNPEAVVSTEYIAPDLFHFKAVRKDITYHIHIDKKQVLVISSDCPKTYIKKPLIPTDGAVSDMVSSVISDQIIIPADLIGFIVAHVNKPEASVKLEKASQPDLYKVSITMSISNNRTAHLIMEIGKKDHLLRNFFQTMPRGFAFHQQTIVFSHIKINTDLSHIETFSVPNDWKPFVSSAPVPDNATLTGLKKNQLTGSFTLRYHMVAKDVRSPALKEKNMQRQIDYYEMGYELGKLTRQQVDKHIADIRKAGMKPIEDSAMDIVLSSRDGKLLYNTVDTLNKIQSVVIIDKNLYYSISPSTAGALNVDDGCSVSSFVNFPIIGANLPSLDIWRSIPSNMEWSMDCPVNLPYDLSTGVLCKALLTKMSGSVKDSGYVTSTAWFDKLADGSRMTRLVILDPAHPTEEWILDDALNLNGAWIPRKIQKIDYNSGERSSEAVYTLVESSAASLDEAAFNIRTYLKDKQIVNIQTGDRYNTFHYDATDSGDLFTMDKRVQAKEEAENQKRLDAIDQSNEKAIAAIIKAGGATPARTLYGNACGKARAERKNVLLVFNATWCGPGCEFESILANPAVQPIIGKYFVVIHLDEFENGKSKALENTGARELLKLYGGERSGIPYQAITDPNGRMLSSGLMKNGNPIGMPTLPNEIDEFVAMLQKTSPAMTADEADVIRKEFTKK